MKIVSKLVFGFGTMLALAACGSSEPGPPSREELAAFAKGEALKRVKEKLRDPDTAKFEDVTPSWKAGILVVCGQVNGANAFGGKVGYQRFISNGVDVTYLEEEVKDGEFDGLQTRYCE